MVKLKSRCLELRLEELTEIKLKKKDFEKKVRGTFN